MNEFNEVLFALISRSLAVVLFSIVLTRQLMANFDAKDDRFNFIRVMVTFLLSSVVVTNMPGIAYLYLLSIGAPMDQLELLRSVNFVVGSLAWVFAGLVAFVISIYNIPPKGKNNGSKRLRK